MSSLTTEWEKRSANWRQSIRDNTRKSRFVIASFFMLYAFIGLLIDATIVSTTNPTMPPSDILMSLLTLQIFPIATLILLLIAGIALMVTFKMHDKLMLLGTDSREITEENTQSMAEKQLYNVMTELQLAAGLKYLPRIFIIDADYMNAFASGYSEKSAIVAITRGLLEKLDRAELQAVMAHELSHIRHMDIKLTLMASVLANISLIVIDLLFRGVLYSGMGSRRSSGGNGRSGNAFIVVIMVLRFALPLITMLLTLYLSRSREYMADAGCVQLTRDNEPLARALIKISGDHEANAEAFAQEYRETPHEEVRRAAYIYDPAKAGITAVKSISNLFATHPALEDRLAALGFKRRSR